MSRRWAVLVVLLLVGLVTLGAVAAQQRVADRREAAAQAFARLEPGMREAEVARLLGPPDPTVQDLAPAGGDCVVYVRADRTSDPFVAVCFADGVLRRVVTLGPPSPG